MSDIGDLYRANKEASKLKRASNREQSAELLREKGIVFTSNNNGVHLIVEGNEGFIDFWPGTGKWIDRATKKEGFGVRNLIRFITV